MKTSIFLITLFAVPAHAMFRPQLSALKKLQPINLSQRRSAILPKLEGQQESELFRQIQKVIAEPTFDLQETGNLIKNIKHSEILKSEHDIALLMNHIVVKATEFKQDEDKYAQVLEQFFQGGCSSLFALSCPQELLHDAVESDLPSVTQAIFNYDEMLHQIYFTFSRKNTIGALINRSDRNGRIPLHYARSEVIARKLIENGSEIGSTDFDGNAPIHTIAEPAKAALLERYDRAFWARDRKIPEKKPINLKWIQVFGEYVKITPLRNAVYTGNLAEYELLQKTLKTDGRCKVGEDPHLQDASQKESLLLRAIAQMQFWRTGNEKYNHMLKRESRRLSLLSIE